MRAGIEALVEHLERTLERLRRLLAQPLIPLLGRIQELLAGQGKETRLKFRDRPEAPLVGTPAILGRCGPEQILPVLFRKVKVYRHRLPDDEPIVGQGRDVTVGIELEMLGRFGLCCRGRDVLVAEPEFLQSP